MKKLKSVVLTIIVLLNSFAFANPVSIGEYDASAFTMFESSMGVNGSFIFGLSFTIIMCIVTLIIVFKALDLKSRPENKKRAIITFTIILLLMGGGFVSLVYQKNHSNHYAVKSMDSQEIIRYNIMSYNTLFFNYKGINKTGSHIRSLIDIINRHNSNKAEVDEYGRVDIVYDNFSSNPIKDGLYLKDTILNSRYYTVDVIEYHDLGSVKTIKIEMQKSYLHDE